MSAVAPPLVTPDWLAAQLGHPHLLVLDIRTPSLDGGGRAAYEAGHVPGSVHSDYAADGWRVAEGGAGGLLPPPGHLAELLGRLGVTPTSHVVVVPAGLAPVDFSAAARVYWTLKAAGHGPVSILDGGFRSWEEHGGPVQPGPGVDKPAPAYPVRPDESVRAGLATVEAAARGGGAALLDGRSAAQFAGLEKSPQAARAGRLPGAVHLDHARAFVPGTGRLKGPDELESLFAPVLPADAPVVSYCNTGHLAAANWFVLSEVLGRRDVTLYDGSMSEWTADPGRPVEEG